MTKSLNDNQIHVDALYTTIVSCTEYFDISKLCQNSKMINEYIIYQCLLFFDLCDLRDGDPEVRRLWGE